MTSQTKKTDNKSATKKTAASKAKAEETAVKTETAKDADVKTETKKTTTAKATSEKTAAKKESSTAASKKSAVQAGPISQIVIQYLGNESTIDSIVEKVTNAYVAEGHRASSIKDLRVYLKPEEGAAYYVINEKVVGKVDLF